MFIEADDDMRWLRDVTVPLVVQGPGWKKKVAQVMALPRWFYEPDDDVKAYFAWRRGEGPEPHQSESLLERVHLHASNDLVAFFWHFCVVKDRDTRKKGLVNPTPSQLIIIWRIMELVDAGLPVRLDILKERQSGMSFLLAWVCCWIVNFHPRREGVLAAQDRITTEQVVFRYILDAYEALPPFMRASRYRKSAKELWLREKPEDAERTGDVGMDSSIRAQTAGYDFVGTGAPLQLLVADEVGKWDKHCDTETVYTSVANAMQDTEWTFLFRSSTAHGAGTFWHREYLSSKKMGRAGWSGHTPVFLAWYLDPRNRKRVLVPLELCDSENAEYGDEVSLKRIFDLDDEQLEWRRGAIRKNPEGRRVELFKQEHPSTDDEAWLFAYGKWLPAEIARAAYERTAEEIKNGSLRPVFVGDFFHHRELGKDKLRRLSDGQNESTHFRRRSGGPLIVYRWPDPMQDYLAAGDVGGVDYKVDHSSIYLYQRVGYPSPHVDGGALMRLAAVWYGNVEEDEFAHILWALGWLYSCKHGSGLVPAHLAWEKNAGRNVARHLRVGVPENPEPYPLSRMHRSRKEDSLRHTFDQHFGISTNKQSKPIMLAAWLEAARDGTMQLTPDALVEAQELVRDERGLVDTTHKDHFMGTALAAYAATSVMPLRGTPEAASDEPPPYTAAWIAWNAKQRRQTNGPNNTVERVLDLER